LETCHAISLIRPVSETNRKFFFSIERGYLQYQTRSYYPGAAGMFLAC
jgi:hypothetical protein